MNFKLLFSISFFLLFLQLNYAQVFEKVTGKATDITINPQDGAVYVVGLSKRLFKYNQTNKKFDNYGPAKGDYSEVAISPKGKMYAIHGSTKNLLKFNHSHSVEVIGKAKYQALAIDKNNHPWIAVGNSNDLQQYYLGTWKAAVSLPIKNIISVAPYSENLCYVVKSNKSILKFSNGTWIRMPGKGTEIVYDQKRNEVYLIGTSKRIFKLNKSTDKWEALKGTRNDFKKIAVYDGVIWALTTSNKIYHYNRSIIPLPKKGTISQPQKGKSIIKNNSPVTRTRNNHLSNATPSTSSSSKTKDYAGTYRFTFTRLLTVSPEQMNHQMAMDLFGTMGIYLEAVGTSGAVQIKPINKKKNRVLDIPQGSPAKIRAHSKKEMLGLGRDNRSIKFSYYGEYEIDRIREFQIAGAEANGQLTFDLQTNMTKKELLGNKEYGWKRKKINVDDIIFGEEYFFTLYIPEFHNRYIYIGYTITKD